MNIFVTGASGYIGRVVSEKLQQAGHRVVGLARSDEASARLQAWGVLPHRGTLFDAGSLAEAATAADAVIHLGATLGPEWAAGDRAAVHALLNALDGSHKPFLYTSSALIYGDTHQHVVDEEDSLTPLPFFLWRPAVEREVLAAVQRGVRSIILRPVTVYGRSGSSSVLLLLHFAQKEQYASYIGTGENRWSLVHVDDLADLYVQALERAPAGTVLNAAAGASISMKELALAISAAIGQERVVASQTLEQARAAFGPRADSLTMNQQISGAKAMLLLGWNPRSPSPLYEIAYGSYRLAASASEGRPSLA